MLAPAMACVNVSQVGEALRVDVRGNQQPSISAIYDCPYLYCFGQRRTCTGLGSGGPKCPRVSISGQLWIGVPIIILPRGVNNGAAPASDCSRKRPHER